VTTAPDNPTDEETPDIDQAEPDEDADARELREQNKVLRETIFQLKMELDRFKSPALMVAEVLDVQSEEEAVIRVPNGNKFLVNLSDDVGPVSVNDTVVVEQKNLTVVDNLDFKSDADVDQFVIVEQPTVAWDQIGGLDKQKNELQEVIEMPLQKPDMFRDVGIKPPKGVLLHGPPGTGKTLMAKAVANSTDSTFIEIVGSELVQKFIGEGAKLVKKIFEMARERSPSIIFIDEIDAIASTRVEIGTSGEREVQRTFMQLLAEIDGFEPLDDVKIIGCTNRKDVMDKAVTRPGRLDRMIKVDAPNEEGIEEIFSIHTEDMKLGDLNESRLFTQMKGMTGAEIYAVCTEAGYFAIREDRKQLQQSDFEQAIRKVREEDEAGEDYLTMFG
jgi:proteasome regulatory subunit